MEEREPVTQRLSAAPWPGYFEPEPVPTVKAEGKPDPERPVIEEGKPARSVLLTVPVWVAAEVIVTWAIRQIPEPILPELNPDLVFCTLGVLFYSIFGYWSRSVQVTTFVVIQYAVRFMRLHQDEPYGFRLFAAYCLVCVIIFVPAMVGVTFGKYGRFRLSEFRHLLSTKRAKK